MIRIDRSDEREPDILLRGTGGPADREHERARDFYAHYDLNRQGRSFQFTVYRHQSVKDALKRLFHGKCAYCETPLAASPGDIEQYRPKSGLIAADGALLPLHYWWLANEWSNLYIACIYCNRVMRQDDSGERGRSGKGNRFPLVDEAQRAPVEARAIDLRMERPLILDPCADDVENILIFSEDGKVSSSDIRGQTTIEILGLNREILVEPRRALAKTIRTLLDTLATLEEESQLLSAVTDDLNRLRRADSPYASLARQLINAGLQSTSGQRLAPRLKEELKSEDSATPTQRLVRSTKNSQRQFQEKQEAYSLEDEDSPTATAYVHRRDLLVERIVVRNMRGIGRIDLKPSIDASRGPWLMLLGENASGKSTVLQALALALTGKKYRGQLLEHSNLRLTDLVRTGADHAEIRIKLSGAIGERRLIIRSDGRIETKGRDAQLMLLGYGSTRLLPRGTSPEPTEPGTYARLENLFNPFKPLIDAEQWLIKADEATFDYAAVAIKKTLNIPLSHRLERTQEGVGLLEHGILTPLARLCDGYQTVIALIVDILSIVLPAWKTPKLAQGLVLIDEVGNHLHPSWKLRFVESFREVLPGMQVIATTHEPLCLRGLGEGEVALLRRGRYGGVQLVEDLPSIEGLRIDQILMSEHFGLQSTLDPSLQSLFDRYHALLRKPAPNKAERAEIEALRTKINDIQVVGHSERERRMLAAIDRFLADPKRFAAADDRDLREAELDAELEAIWNRPLGEAAQGA